MRLNVVPPAPPRVEWGWFVLSAGINALVLTGLVWLAGQKQDVQPLVLAMAADSPDIEYMVYLVPAQVEMEPAGEGARVTGRDESPENPVERLPVLPAQPEQQVEVVAPPTEVPTEIVALDPDSMLSDAVIGNRRLLGPSFGSGELWVPVELTPQDRALIAIHLADIDSLYRKQLIAAIQAIPPDSFALAGSKPWVTEVNGQTWGIDGQFIHLGPIKIPTVLLALLPIPATGNFDQAVEAREYERIRQEILFHAARQADREQIDDYIKELREREDERRRQRRALLARPDTIVAARDTIIPR